MNLTWLQIYFGFLTGTLLFFWAFVTGGNRDRDGEE